MSRSESYPNNAYILSLIGGIFILLAGLLIGLVGAAVTFMFAFIGGALGLFGIIWGIIIIVGAINLRAHPDQHVTWGVVILVFSLISWVGAFGGFFIGFLLSLVGGILGIVWSPPRTQAPTPAYVPPPSAQAPSAAARFCPNCGASVNADTKFCPHCGKQLS